MSYSLNSLKGVMWGSIIGGRLDYSSYGGFCRD